MKNKNLLTLIHAKVVYYRVIDRKNDEIYLQQSIFSQLTIRSTLKHSQNKDDINKSNH